MKTPPAQQAPDLTPEQLEELNTLTSNVERALLPVARERDEVTDAADREAHTKDLRSSIRSL